MSVKLRLSITLFLLIISFFVRAQIRNEEMYHVNDSLIIKKGIYFSKQELMSNSPSVTYLFNVVRKTHMMSVFTSSNDFYLLEYYDFLGNKISLSLTDVWAFCNDQNLYFCYRGRPFGVYLLGNISILTYYDYYTEPDLYSNISDRIDKYISNDKLFSEFVLMNFKDEIYVRANSKNLFRMMEDFSTVSEKFDTKLDVFKLDEAVTIINEFNLSTPIKISLPKENSGFLSVDFFGR